MIFTKSLIQKLLLLFQLFFLNHSFLKSYLKKQALKILISHESYFLIY